MPPKKTANKATKANEAKMEPVINPNSSFTPAAFEKELQALAAKAKEETWGRWLKQQAAVYTKSSVLLVLAAVYANVSELALSPVYGSIPVSIWHNKLVLAALFVGWSCNLHLGRLVPVKLPHLLPLIAVYIPTVQFFLFKFSGFLTAYQGPFVTELLTLVPLLIFSVSCTANYLEGAELSALPGFIRDAAPGIGSYSFYRLSELISAKLLNRYIGQSIFQTRVVLQMLLSVSYALVAPTKLLLFTIPAVLHTALFNTHVMSPMATHSLNTTLAAKNWTLIDRKESLTGYISVLDNLQEGYRVMRCDHSLLGGEWIRFKGLRVAEPIYGVFTMLEAVRLVETPEPIVDQEANALVM